MTVHWQLASPFICSHWLFWRWFSSEFSDFWFCTTSSAGPSKNCESNISSSSEPVYLSAPQPANPFTSTPFAVPFDKVLHGSILPSLNSIIFRKQIQLHQKIMQLSSKWFNSDTTSEDLLTIKTLTNCMPKSSKNIQNWFYHRILTIFWR